MCWFCLLIVPACSSLIFISTHLEEKHMEHFGGREIPLKLWWFAKYSIRRRRAHLFKSMARIGSEDFTATVPGRKAKLPRKRSKVVEDEFWGMKQPRFKNLTCELPGSVVKPTRTPLQFEPDVPATQKLSCNHIGIHRFSGQLLEVFLEFSNFSGGVHPLFFISECRIAYQHAISFPSSRVIHW